jgi:hypothetical protein
MTSVILECSICSEKFDNTNRRKQMLPCLHTFCSQCIKDMIAISIQDSCVLKCFQCAEPFDDVKLYCSNTHTIECSECQYLNDLPYDSTYPLGTTYHWNNLTDQFVCNKHSDALNITQLYIHEIDDYMEFINKRSHSKIAELESFETRINNVSTTLASKCTSMCSAIKESTDKLINMTNVPEEIDAIGCRRKQLYDKVFAFRDPIMKNVLDAMDNIAIDRDIQQTLNNSYDQLIIMIASNNTLFSEIMRLLIITKARAHVFHDEIVPVIGTIEFYLEIPDEIDLRTIPCLGYVGPEVKTFTSGERCFDSAGIVDFCHDSTLGIITLLVDDNGFYLRLDQDHITVEGTKRMIHRYFVECDMTPTKFAIRRVTAVVIFRNCSDIHQYSLDYFAGYTLMGVYKLHHIPSNIAYAINGNIIVTYKSINTISCFTTDTSAPLWETNINPWIKQTDKPISVGVDNIYVNNFVTIFVLDFLGVIIKQIPMMCDNMIICPIDKFIITYDIQKNRIRRYTAEGEQMPPSTEFDAFLSRSSLSNNIIIKSLYCGLIFYADDVFSVYVGKCIPIILK